MNRNWILAGVGLAILAIAGRVLPHAANLTPLYAVALFACAVFPRGTGMWVPMAAMVASDLFLGLHDTVLFTWTGMLLFCVLGYLLRGQRSTARLALTTLTGSTLFFLWTNFGVWMVSGLYPHTVSGLTQCYVLALPFFRNSLLGDLAFAGALFAAYDWVRLRRAARVAAMATV